MRAFGIDYLKMLVIVLLFFIIEGLPKYDDGIWFEELILFVTFGIVSALIVYEHPLKPTFMQNSKALFLRTVSILGSIIIIYVVTLLFVKFVDLLLYWYVGPLEKAGTLPYSLTEAGFISFPFVANVVGIMVSCIVAFVAGIMSHVLLKQHDAQSLKTSAFNGNYFAFFVLPLISVVPIILILNKLSDERLLASNMDYLYCVYPIIIFVYLRGRTSCNIVNRNSLRKS